MSILIQRQALSRPLSQELALRLLRLNPTQHLAGPSASGSQAQGVRLETRENLLRIDRFLAAAGESPRGRPGRVASSSWSVRCAPGLRWRFHKSAPRFAGVKAGLPERTNMLHPARLMSLRVGCCAQRGGCNCRFLPTGNPLRTSAPANIADLNSDGLKPYEAQSSAGTRVPNGA